MMIVVGALLVLVLTKILTTSSWSRVLAMYRKRGGGGEKFPEGPPGWPIVGHLPLLASRSKAVHQVLADLSQAYGPMTGLRLGSRPAIIVSGIEPAKEVLLTHDKIFANRPHYRLADDLFFGYNNSVLLGSYSPRWVRLRKMYTLELLTAKRLQQLQYIRQDEIRRLLEALLRASDGGREAVEVRKLTVEMTGNMTGRLLLSATLVESAPDLPDLITRTLDATGVPTVGDFIPWLKFLDVLQVRRMRCVQRRYKHIIDSMLSKRRQAMKTTPPLELPQDFLQVILSKEMVEDPEERLTTQEIRAIVADILAGGIHTTTATIEWGLMELVGSGGCMQKLREEVDEVMNGREGPVTDEDVVGMPYLEKVVKEILRLHPVIPLLPPRVSSEECKVGEYLLPKGTQAIVNVWALARDPLLWGPTAGQFMPERFEGADVDLKGHHFQFLPFGSGRRACAGIRLGLSIVHVTLANLVRAFDWEFPPHATLDLSEKADSFTNVKATPSLAIPKPRLALSNYLM